MADDAGKTFSFGNAPPRSLESFGVAGLLGEKSKVFYSSIFTTKHIGRVTDLIAAKLHDEGLDELRLRALLLFSAFEVFRTQGGAGPEASKQRLTEPLVVECGVDEDRIAVGVSFTADEERFPRLDGLVQRITDGNPEGEFEKLLSEIHSHSDRTVVRGQPGIRRVEIIALLGIPGKIDPSAVESKAPLLVVEIPADQKSEPPKVNAYVELGDLDYPKLLKETINVQDEAPPATGEVLMHGCKELDDAVKVRAAHLLEAIAATRVKGAAEDASDVNRVKGGKGKDDDSMFKVTSGGAIQASDSAVFIKGNAAEADQGGGYKLRSIDIPKIPEAGEPGAVPAAAAQEQAGDDEDSDSRNKLQDVIEKVKSAWPFRLGKGKAAEGADAAEEAEEESESAEEAAPQAAPKKTKKKAAAPAAEAEEEEEVEEEEASPAPDQKKKKAEGSKTGEADEAQKEEEDDSEELDSAPPPVTQPIKISADDIQKEAQKLTNEIESGIEKTVTRAQGEAGDLKKEMGSTRAKRWVDGLMTELVAEKARLAEASKALNASIKLKEIEFRTKEQMLTEELKRRDDMIRQKTNALNRAKEQLSQAAMSAERLKSAKGAGGDDVHYKQKYTLVQKMLNSAKDENKELVEKIEDLKNQLMSNQLNSSKRNQPSASDFTALQAKYERALRQSDEFKKNNQQLMDKLTESKKERGGGPQEDMKKRLEAAMKMATGHQRDAEKLQERVEEMQREHMRLQAELNKANQELKSARVGSKAGSSDVPATAAVSAAKPAAAAKPAPTAPRSTLKQGQAKVHPPSKTGLQQPGAKPPIQGAPKPAQPGAAPKAPLPAAAKPAQPAAAAPAAAKPGTGTGNKGNPPKAA